MEIRLHDLDLSMENRYHEMKLIKKIDRIKMYKDIDFGGFIVVDGRTYKQCSYNIKEDILCVEPTELNEHPEEIEWSSDFVCPYCGYKDIDAFELSDSGETECSSCGSELEYEREYTVEYNIRPVKCAPVTKA